MSTPVLTGNAYDKYRSRNPIERRLMKGFFAALRDSLPREQPQTVLEVGVGEGEVSARLRSLYPDAKIVGVDLHDEVLAARWRTRDFAGVYADIAALPFPPQAFDLVMVVEVLEHVPEPPAALAELVRVSRGRLVLSVPREPIWRVANVARGKYLADLGNTPGHIQHWSRRGFAALVASQLEVLSVSTPFPWTMIGARSRPAPRNGSAPAAPLGPTASGVALR
ncbi:MAG TPA: class I SAM-dependent methyltransferase [Acidimicrobiales bacterium]|nr:class I SAM-dependent methyltransferase [Acidimicrobiales bacterium]